MPFGRTGKQNNRSTSQLPEPPAAVGAPGSAGAANAPSSASSTGFSSNESFDTRTPGAGQQQQGGQQQQQQQLRQQQKLQTLSPPSPLIYGGSSPVAAQQQLQNQAAGSSPVFEGGGVSSSKQKSHDIAELVARSQSQRYPQVTPIQTAQQYGIASSSVDDLPNTLNITSPGLPHQGLSIAALQQQQQQHQQHLQQQQPPAPPEPNKRSARRLIKGFLSGGSSSSGSRAGGSDQQSSSYGNIPPASSTYDNTGGLARRPSKRVVGNAPTIRTGLSQVSLDQVPADWQSQGRPQNLTQPSPLQGVGEFEAYSFNVVDESSGSNRDPRLQLNNNNNPPILEHPPLGHRASIRHVVSDQETSPYDELAYQQHHQQALQADGQQQQFGGAVSYETSPQQPQQPPYQYPSPQHAQYQGAGNQPPLYIGHLATNPQHQNPDTISQLSHESPITDSDQRSEHQTSSPQANYSLQSSDLSQPPAPPPQQQQPGMAPSGPGSQRRSAPADSEKGMRGADLAPGPPPGYRHSQSGGPNSGMNNPLPPVPPGGQPQGAGAGVPPPPAAAAYRQSTAGQYDQAQPGGEQGRNSPQPSSEREGADPEKAFKDLLTKYKNVKRLYFENKAQIETMSAQVEQLQNAIANQRMSQSRTSLDDSEYTTRFNRLGGAINNLAFNIRKDWRSLPPWLAPYVSADALKTGKQEMTAVGRAVVTKWLVDEVFDASFHPGLDHELSRHLKEVEQNIRRFSYKMTSQEEFEALTLKVVAWRMATLEGLARVLGSAEAAEHRLDFTRRATTNLTAALMQYLADPAPAGVEGSASMIVELAVGIACNVPLESRDVCVAYPMPGDPVRPDLMEVEKAGLPPPAGVPPTAAGESGAGAGSGDGDDASAAGDDSGKDDAGGGGSVGGKAGGGSKKGAASADKPQGKSTGGQAGSATQSKDVPKVRFAGFLTVEVRGRQVLVRAPVWTL